MKRIVKVTVFLFCVMALPPLAVVAAIGALIGEWVPPAGCLTCARKAKR